MKKEKKKKGKGWKYHMETAKKTAEIMNEDIFGSNPYTGKKRKKKKGDDWLAGW